MIKVLILAAMWFELAGLVVSVFVVSVRRLR